ncbi:hypothetical protein GCM10009101_31510 [Brevundimonas lenta]
MRYLVALAYLAACVPPLLYAGLGVLLFLTPKLPRTGGLGLLDWVVLGVCALTIVLVGAGIVAYLGQRCRPAWLLLVAAYLPLVLAQTASVVL